MAITTRNLYLVLKARDEASRIVRGFGRELTRAGAVADAETLRQRANIAAVENAERSLAQQRRINDLRNRAARASEALTIMQSQGASANQLDRQRATIKHLRAQAAALERENNLLNKQSALATQQLRSQASELERGHRAAIRFSNALHMVSATLVTVGSGTAVLGAGILAFLFSTVKVAAEYERQVRLTSTQMDNFTASLDDFAQVGLRVAKTIAVPFETIQPALYDILSSTNANLKQAEILLVGFSKTAVAGQVTLQEASRGTIPILNAFNIPLEKVNDILDIQFELVRKGVGTYGEFAKIFGRVVPSATRAGQNFQMVAAMLAFLTRNGLSAAMASTSAARALEAMSHPKAVKEMEKLGLKMRDAAGNFLPLNVQLQNLRKHLEKMPKSERVAALVDIFKGAGGTIQARRFLEQVLLRPGELEEFEGFLKDMNSATGQFDKAYGTMAGSVASQTELMRNKWKVLQETVGRIMTPAFLAVIGVIQKVLDAFNNLDPKWQRVIVIGTLVAGAFLLIAGGVLIFLGVLAGIVAAVATAGATFFYLVGGVTAVVLGLAALGVAFYTAWKNSEGLRDLLIQIRDSAISLYRDAIQPTAAAILKAWNEHITPALEKFSEVLENRIMPIWQSLYFTFTQQIIPAAREVGNTIKDWVGKGFEIVGGIIEKYVVPWLAKVQEWYLSNKETIDMVITALVFLGKWFLKIVGFIILLSAAIGATALIAGLMMFIGFLMAIVNASIQVIKWIRNIINWFKNLGSESSSVTKAIGTAWDKTINFFGSIPTKIKTAVGDLGTLLLDAGKALLDGLINGIKSKFGALGNIMGGVAKKIKDYLPGSPAKVGPLAGAGGMFYSGRELVRQFQSGIQSMTPTLGVSMSGMATTARARTLEAPRAGAGGGVNQTFNITTQEIDPRRHSAELGWQLAGRT